MRLPTPFDERFQGSRPHRDHTGPRARRARVEPKQPARGREIWDSREQFKTFGERLMPILADTGIEFSGEPEIFEVHNIIKR